MDFASIASIERKKKKHTGGPPQKNQWSTIPALLKQWKRPWFEGGEEWNRGWARTKNGGGVRGFFREVREGVCQRGLKSRRGRKTDNAKRPGLGKRGGVLVRKKPRMPGPVQKCQGSERA